MTRLLIPQLDANLIDVTITRWNKNVGDSVSTGESVAELTTDKAVYELEAPVSGTLLVIYAAEKSVVPTGFIAGLIGTPGESDPEIDAENAARIAAYRGEAAPAVPAAQTAAARVRATPRARRLAQEKGLDLAKIQAETGAEIIDEALLARYL